MGNRKKYFMLILSVLILLAITGCSERLAENKVYSASDLRGKTVGVLYGSAAEMYIETLTDVTVQRYEDVGILARALRDGVLDCAVCGVERLKEVRKAASGIVPLEERLVKSAYCMAVSTDNVELIRRLNETLEALEQDGTLEEIVSGGKKGELPEPPEFFTGEVVTVAIVADFPPYAFYENGELTGVEIRLVQAVCKRLGLTPQFVPVEREKLMYMAGSGKVSFAVGRITSESSGEGVSCTNAYDVDEELILVRKYR